MAQKEQDAGLGNVQEVRSDSDYQTHFTSAGNKLIIVDFSTTWCPPSVMMEPVFASLSEKYSEAVFMKVDADICGETAQLFHIRVLPTFVVIKNGVEFQRIQGADPEGLETTIANAFDFPDSRITTEALQRLEANDINVCDEVAPIWLEIAKHIALRTKDIDQILSEYSDAPECCKAMFQLWMSPGAPRPATWRVLLEALRAHGKEELALQIEKSEEGQTKESQLGRPSEELRQMYEEMLAKKDNEIARIKLTFASGEKHLQKQLKEANQMILFRDEEIKTLKHQMQQTPGPTLSPERSPQTFQRECIIPGVEAVGSTSVWMVSGAKPYTFKTCGVRLRIPKEATLSAQPPTELEITPSLAGQYQFPDDCELVSGVYWITYPHEFLQPASLDIQHCINLTRTSQFSSLSFVRAKSTQDLPYKFELIEGGVFSPNTSHGTIKITEFSPWAIVEIIKYYFVGGDDTQQQVNPAERNYAAQFFYEKESAYCTWTLHFVIYQSLEINKTAIQKWYEGKEVKEDPAVTTVQYEKEEITLDIPMKGIENGPWSLLPRQYPAIKRSYVDAYKPSQQIPPKCHVRLKWKDVKQQPTELIQYVELIGAKKPHNEVNIIFEPGPQTLDMPAMTNTDLNRSTGQGSSGIGPSKHIEICKLLQPLSQDQLQELGLNLKLSIDRVTGYGPVTKCQYTHNLVRDWTNKSDYVVDATWLSLEQALRESGQNGIADLVSKRAAAESYHTSAAAMCPIQDAPPHCVQVPHCTAKGVPDIAAVFSPPISQPPHCPTVPHCPTKDCIEEATPRLQHLMDLVAARVPSKWRLIGTSLGLDESELSRIEEKEYADKKDCFRDIFTVWKERMIEKYKWKTILEALKCPDVNESQVAEEIRPKLRKMLSAPQETSPKVKKMLSVPDQFKY